jgi:hypothetical protein
MSEPMDELELEHGEILGHLLRIRAADYRREVTLPALHLAREGFLRHVEHDVRLVLRPLAADPSRQAVAAQFQRQMQVLTREMLAFFDRFGASECPPYGIEFAMELGRLTQRLRHRMQYEEAQLYPLVRCQPQAALA